MSLDCPRFQADSNLLFLTPGGFENYFDDVAQLVAKEGAWPPKDMSKLQAIQAKYDMRYPEKVGA